MKNKSFLHHMFTCIKRYKKQKQINKNKDYFKEERTLLKNIAKQWGIPFLSLYLNYLLTLVLFGEAAQYYVLEEMYKYNLLEKNRRMTVYRAFKLDYEFNINASDEEKDILLYKNKFNKEYIDFTKREFVYPKESSKEEIVAFINKHNSVFCKPNNGTNGEQSSILSINELTDDKIQELIDGEYILEELIKQSEAMSKLNASSVNTLRIFTIIDNKGNVLVKQPLLRVGVSGCAVDNVSQNGIFYLVDEETGIIYTRGRNLKDISKHIYHPGTDIVMLGFKIPMYEEICEMVKKAAKKHTNLRYIGWDVAITDNGPVLIEGNIEYGATLHGSDGRYREIKKYL